MTTPPAVVVEGLRVRFPGPEGPVTVVDDVSFTLSRGETLAIVGESGSGKTMMSLSLLGLVPAPGAADARTMTVDGIDVRSADDRVWAGVRGRHAAMVFQDALSGLNPVRTVGSVLVETIRRHQGLGRAEARRLAIDELDRVGIPDPAVRFDVYPHQLSGGLRQRVMIALALVNRPGLVIADEPTTALDATIQAQIIELLAELVADSGLILITHDLGVAAAIADRVAVMYAGRFVEVGSATDVMRSPAHPYAAGLLAAVPRFDRDRNVLVPIPGAPPSPASLPAGCAFAPRCDRALDRCQVETPALESAADRLVACWNPLSA